MKKVTKIVSRRQFLAVGGLASTGAWLSFSDQFSARFARAFLRESGRPTARSPYHPEPASWSPQKLTATWIGHATVLLNFYGATILTDPVFANRVGADLGFATLGRKRRFAPALRLVDLPKIDLILLSHAHMDHFDLPSLRAFSPSTRVITARATSDLLRTTPLQAQELDWNQDTIISTSSGDVRVEAFQVNHWGARWSRDTYRGFNGYIVEKAGKKMIFGGDTALCEHFAAIRDRGPFELALMPIGSYRPGRSSHCTPEEAARMFNDCGGHYLLPIHHKTFALGPEPMNEPMERLSKVVSRDRIALWDTGQTFTLG